MIVTTYRFPFLTSQYHLQPVQPNFCPLHYTRKALIKVANAKARSRLSALLLWELSAAFGGRDCSYTPVALRWALLMLPSLHFSLSVGVPQDPVLDFLIHLHSPKVISYSLIDLRLTFMLLTIALIYLALTCFWAPDSNTHLNILTHMTNRYLAISSVNIELDFPSFSQIISSPSWPNFSLSIYGSMIHSIALTINLGVIIATYPSLKLYIQSIVRLLNYISNHGPRPHPLSFELLPWPLLSTLHRAEVNLLKHKSDSCHTHPHPPTPTKALLCPLIMLKINSKWPPRSGSCLPLWPPLKPLFLLLSTLQPHWPFNHTHSHLKTIAPAVLTAWRTLQTLRSLCASLPLIQASAQMAPWRRFLHALAQAVPCLPTPIPRCFLL